MAKFQSPLLGYNNNVRHKNRVFHIQTEDSGVTKPHIITHLFMDGGRILKSVKQSYAEHVGTDGMNDLVRGMMKEQHKGMFIALRDGQFDALVDQGTMPKLVPAAAIAVPTPTDVRPVTEDSAASSASAAPPSARSIDTAPEIPALSATISERPPVLARQEGPSSAANVTLDIDAVERAAEHGGEPPSAASDLPPPPKNLFSREPSTGGAYRAVDSDPPPPPSAMAPPPKPAPAPGDGRYAPARPAAIFGSSRPSSNARPGASIFGDELISDKSLDEVILSFLAEDLDPPPKRK